MTSMGAAALLRIAALPVQAWLSGGAPDIFASSATLDEEAARKAAAATGLAARIGERLVPHPGLDDAGRALALRCRRALHQGTVPPEAAGVADLAVRVLPGDPLAADLSGLAAEAEMMARCRSELHRQIRAEEQRLLGLPWQLLHDHAAGRRALRAGDLLICDDIARRLAAGEPWTTKRMRQRSDYLWRMIARSSTRATPRGWLAHVAALSVGEGWTGDGPLTVLARVAVDTAENLDHGRSAEGTAPALPSLAVPLALAPLHLIEPGHLRVWTLAGAQRTSLRQIRLRRSALLDELLVLLPGTPVPAVRIVDEVAGLEPRQREAVTSLITHLVHLGVLQACPAPRRTLTRWASISGASATVASPTVASADDFTDVYRQAKTGLDLAYAERLSCLVELALRVGALVDTGEQETDLALPSAITCHRRPLLDIFAECAAHGIRVPRGPAHHHDWPVVRDPGSGHADLYRWLGARLDGPDPIDIDAATLDMLGAPPADLHWPMDALIQPIGGSAGVLGYLSQVAPAGRLDARFLPTLGLLGADVAQQAAYREFLDALGGVVEILVPPLSPRGANGVRRPACATRWTGDPDLACYIADRAASYVPLSAITLRRAGDRVVAEADGEPIRPVAHTARISPPGWDILVDLLMLASPQPVPLHWRALQYTLTGWPERSFMPRITVGNALVLSLAQWRVDMADLWHRDDPVHEKVAALARLRRSRGLPRLVTFVADPHDDPVAADLASLVSIRLFERAIQRGATSLLLCEFPAERPVRDAANAASAVAELLLRIPVATSPGQAARRAADHLDRLHGELAGSTVYGGGNYNPHGSRDV